MRQRLRCGVGDATDDESRRCTLELKPEYKPESGKESLTRFWQRIYRRKTIPEVLFRSPNFCFYFYITYVCPTYNECDSQGSDCLALNISLVTNAIFVVSSQLLGGNTVLIPLNF